jgi:hypothetical protein
MEFDRNLVELLQDAKRAKYTYAVFMSDYCFNQRQQAPYFVRISTLLRRLFGAIESDFWAMAKKDNAYCLDLDLGIGFLRKNTESNFIMFYGGDAKPQISDFENFMGRWADVTEYVLDNNRVSTDSEHYLGT